MDFTKYLVENAYVLIPVLYILGNILKDLKFISDKYIPIILLGLGILLACGWLGFNITSIIQGILLTGITVYSNQVMKQLLKNDTSIADITVQALNKVAETKDQVKAEASTTSINNTVSDNSQGIVITNKGLETVGELKINKGSINAGVQPNNFTASAKTTVDIPVEG